MATTTMHFGPEWMRKQPTPSARPPQPDPQTGPPHAIAQINTNTVPPSGGSTYSAHVTPTSAATPENRDVAHPFRYSKEDMIRIYKEAGGRSGLGLEVERWEGIVREVALDPVGLKDPGEAEKKLFFGSLNSEMRRRQSTDYLTPLSTSGLDRPKLDRSGSSVGGSPMRERFGALLGQRRRDSSDQTNPSIPRKLSTSSLQGPLNSPREAPLPSPRTRTGPGFDGVLGASEPWVSKRKESESRLTGPNLREPGGLNGNSEIKEEPEEMQKPADTEQPSASLDSRQGAPSTGNLTQHFQAGHANTPNQFIDGAGPILTNGSNANMAFTEEPTTKRPSPALPDTADLASIEWSYLDVQGQIQGPFRADIMQTWHDQGYFTPDLLMRRTNLDSDWLSVAELQLRASGPKLFLSPWIPPQLTGPPGLTRRQDSPNDGFGQPQPFGGPPYQPIPARSLRTTTLDSYINGASNRSESPSSSFGAARFGNGSPDPTGFGGRAVNSMFGEPPLNSIGIRRSAYADSAIDPTGGRSPFNNAPVRSTSYDNYNLGNEHFVDNPYNKPSYVRGPHDQHSAGSSPFLANATAAGNVYLNGPQAYGVLGQEQPFVGSPSIQYAQNHLVGNLGQPASPLVPQSQHPQYATSATSPSPWGTPDPSGPKRPGPFDPQHPTARNTTVVRQTSPWERTSRAPWATAPQPDAQPEAWVDPEHSLTVSNLEQHNQQQQTPEGAVASGENVVPPTAAENVASEQKPSEEVTPVPAAPAPTVAEVADLETLGVSKPKRKPPPMVKPSQSPQPNTQPPKTPTPPLPSTAPQIKAAWSKEEEAKKAKPSDVAIGFREIQEAEAKKAEARKAAERERERAARTVVTPSEEAPAFVASWGLPTSQVGRNTPSKETSSASANAAGATPPPVWTSVAKPAITKKTMKEIQEEEEKRKKLEASKEKESVSATVRRAYAETTNKNSPVVPGPAWTTVGSSGKSAVTAPTARPPAVSVPSTLSVTVSSTAPRSNTATPVSPRPLAATKPIAPPKVEEAMANPSHDFLRWLSESLKGLNSSVNLEDMSSMLLSFPLDADSSTMEIISDLIYANSTVLDGRRFAAEFVNKRKVDAASRPKVPVASGGVIGKVPSIADIVKAQPKPAQNEWGGFKVVNKKKKGGKA